MNFKEFLAEKSSAIDPDTFPKIDARNPKHGQASKMKETDDFIQYRVIVSKDPKVRKPFIQKIEIAGYKIEGFSKISNDVEAMVVTYDI